MNGWWWQVPAALLVAGAPIAAAELHVRHKQGIDQVVSGAIGLAVIGYFTWLAWHAGGWWGLSILVALVAVILASSALLGVIRGLRWYHGEYGQKRGERWYNYLYILPVALVLTVWEHVRKRVRRDRS